MTDELLSDDDKRLFQEMMRGVKPLKKSSKVVEKKSVPAPIPRKPIPAPENSSYQLSNYFAESVGSNDVLAYFTPNFPNKRFKQLKSGFIRIDARLDLHGLHIEEAKDKLCKFIDNHLEKRLILIIHGKGGYSGAAPVLKNHVNSWLKQLPHVIAFHSALAKDGGTGALYVLLKKNSKGFL